MDNYVANSFDVNYAAAWSSDQGGFSSTLAQNLLAYIQNNNLQYKSCLDIACGTGEFLYHFDKAGYTCYGTEIAKSMVEYSKAKYPNIQFALSKTLYDIPYKTKFDVITCNHDMVNTLERFSEWTELFKNAEKTLNKGGVFMFDFYTEYKLSNWNEVVYEEGEDMDHITQIKKGIDNKCIMNNIYYIKNTDETYKKTFDVEVEAYYKTNEIVDALNKAGFKNVTLCRFSLDPLEDSSTRNRIHVLATK